MDYEYKSYGCPETEMWMFRDKFELEHPHLNLKMRLDAPHYDSKETRIAYSVWEDEL